MNPILYAFYTSKFWVWLLRLRGRVPHGYVLGYSINLREATECVGWGWGGLVTLAFLACLKTGTSITQIKEKYGTLRIYTGPSPKWVNQFIRAVEDVSQYICEDCGAEGKRRPGGWIRTLCDKCYAG